MTINNHQTCSEILCTWSTVISTETGKSVEYLKFFKLLSLILYTCLMQMTPAVSECNISIFIENKIYV